MRKVQWLSQWLRFWSVRSSHCNHGILLPYPTYGSHSNQIYIHTVGYDARISSFFWHEPIKKGKRRPFWRHSQPHSTVECHGSSVLTLVVTLVVNVVGPFSQNRVPQIDCPSFRSIRFFYWWKLRKQSSLVPAVSDFASAPYTCLVLLNVE